MSKRVLAVGGGMGMGIVKEGRKYGMEGACVELRDDLRASIAAGGTPAYKTIEDALAAHKDIVAAYIATPNQTHEQFALALAPLNIPVFMEKPLGIDEAQCRRVVDAYRQSKGWLQIDFEYRFSPMYADPMKLLQSGEMGELRSIYAEYTVGPYGANYGWRLDPDQAGGMFAEKLCHFVDLLRFWTQSEFAEINVTAGPRSIPYYLDTSTDNIAAQFVMDSGVFCNLIHTHGSTAVPRGKVGQNNEWEDYGHRLAVYLNTTEGCIHINIWPCEVTIIKRDMEDNGTPRIVRREVYKHLDFMAAHHDMQGMLVDFVRRVANNEGPRLDVEDSYKTMLAVFECDRQLYASCQKANARFKK